MVGRRKAVFNPGSLYEGPEILGKFRVLDRFKDEEGDIRVRIELLKSKENLTRYEDILLGASKEIIDVEKPAGIAAEDYAFTLGYLSTHANIVADIPYTSQKSFDAKYIDVKGTAPDKDIESYSIHKCSDTWSYSIRVFFVLDHPETEKQLCLPASLEENTSNIDSVTKRISDNEWAWRMLAMGFNIGINHNIDHIRSSIPAEYTKAFDLGCGI